MTTVPENYRDIEQQIRSHALACGRNPSLITLLAVSKRHSLDHALQSYEAGCRDFGENTVQEALSKIPRAPADIRWHLIGTLQKNKVRKAVGQFHLIHSIDTFALAEKLSQCSTEAGVVTPVLLQANTSGEDSKHGFNPKSLEAEFEDLFKLKGLRIQGLMTMAPFVEDEEVIRSCFASLRELRDRLQTYGGKAVQLRDLSMGMTHDWRIAVEEGATILRIGTAIFGERE